MPGSLTFMMRALRYRNYRLFFAGQVISLIGTWMTTTALSWLVYRLTGSALLLGAVAFASQLPAFILAPVAGVFVDRGNRHHIMVATQIASMIESFALAALTLTHQITIPWLLFLTAVQGLINAFDMSARQAFVVELIENKEDLSNAIALNSSMFNLARLIGPSVGGVLIAAVGEGWCFMIDGISYAAVIAALLAMKLVPRRVIETKKDALGQVREGWFYVVGSVPLRSIIGLVALISLVGLPYTVLMPIFAGTVLNGGPHTLGFLMAASGAGALMSALWLASRRSVLGLGRIIALSSGAFGMGLIAFSFSRTLWLSMILIMAAGAAFMLQMASSNTILQTIVDDDKRGRVMSLYIMAFMGSTPFGCLIAGSLSETIGAPRTLMLGGFCCILGSLWFHRRLPAIRAAVRPIYRKLGILPQVAAGLETASELMGPQPRADCS